MKTPIGPIKYVTKSGKANKILFIENLCASFKIHPPTNKLMDTKWVQNIKR